MNRKYICLSFIIMILMETNRSLNGVLEFEIFFIIGNKHDVLIVWGPSYHARGRKTPCRIMQIAHINDGNSYHG